MISNKSIKVIVFCLSMVVTIGCINHQRFTEAEDDCFICHGETATVGEDFNWARAGWENSVHANGMQVAIVDSTGEVLGYEWEGTDAFYSNGGGCQICHTNEGFHKKLSGEYGDIGTIEDGLDYSYTDAAETDLQNADAIAHPSSIGCFTCHAPHTNRSFDRVVPDGTPITTQMGAVFDKPRGSICASCHQSRIYEEANADGNANDKALAAAQGGGINRYFGPHHGPQTDMLLGFGGAEYAGQTYGDSAHTSEANANCITCHMTMPSDSRASLSPNVGGHSFEIVGIVHGSEKGNDAGCNECHGGVNFDAASVDDRYVKTGDVVADRRGVVSKMNDALTLLADPDNNCAGLLQDGYDFLDNGAVDSSVSISFDSRCTITNISAPAANATATEASPETIFAYAIYNFKFVYYEDRSFGIHNTTYALQLLYDSCNELNTMIGGAYDCGTRP